MKKGFCYFVIEDLSNDSFNYQRGIKIYLQVYQVTIKSM